MCYPSASLAVNIFRIQEPLLRAHQVSPVYQNMLQMSQNLTSLQYAPRLSGTMQVLTKTLKGKSLVTLAYKMGTVVAG